MRYFYNAAFLFLLSSFIYSQNNPGTRYGHSMVYFNGKIYLFGGEGSASMLNKSNNKNAKSIELNDLFDYNVDNGTWEKEIPLNATKPRARKGHSAVIWNGKMVVYGGETSGALLNDLWIYDFTTKAWTQITVGGTTPPVANHSAVVEDNKLIIAGGLNLNGGSRDSMNEIDLEHPEQGCQNKPSLPEPLNSGGIFNLNNELWFFGGIWHDWDASTPGNQPSYSSRVFKLANGASSWNEIATIGAVREAAKFAGVFVPGKNAYYMFGGEKYNYSTNQPETLNEAAKTSIPGAVIESLDGDTVDVCRTKQSSAVLAPVTAHTAYLKNQYPVSSASNEIIYLYGGILSNGTILSNFYIFNPDNNTYVKLNSLNAPNELTTVASSSSQVNLTWNDNSNNETGFKIIRKTGLGEYAFIHTAAQNITSYSDNDLVDGTGYTYRIIAINSNGAYSEYSSESSAVTPLNAPTNLTAGLVSSAIQLNWMDNSQSEGGITIDKKVGTGEYAKLTDLPANSVSYTDTDITASINYYYKVKAFNSLVVSGYSNETTSIIVGNQDNPLIPKEFNLAQNYPNPFNPVTNIKFNLPERSATKLIIYDCIGREVITIVNSELEAGTHIVQFNAGNLSSGNYFYRISTPNYTSVKKLIYLK